MSCNERAIAAVEKAAGYLEKEARRIGILRSVEATEASTWLDHVATQMRNACKQDPPPPPTGAKKKADGSDKEKTKRPSRRKV